MIKITYFSGGYFPAGYFPAGYFATPVGSIRPVDLSGTVILPGPDDLSGTVILEDDGEVH